MPNRADWVVNPATYASVSTPTGGTSYVMTPSETLWLPLTAWQGLPDDAGDVDTLQRIAYPEAGGKHLFLGTRGHIHIVAESDPGALFTDMWDRSWLMQFNMRIQSDSQIMVANFSVGAAVQTRNMNPAAANMDFRWEREFLWTNISAGFWDTRPPQRTSVARTIPVNCKTKMWLDPPEIASLVIDVQQYVVNDWESVTDLVQFRVVPRLRSLVIPM